MDQYCHHQGLAAGTPVPQFQDGKICYCCCGCVIGEALVASSEDEFVYMRDLSEGDSVLVYDLDLRCKPCVVNFVSGPTMHESAGPLRLIAFEYGSETRRLVVTPEHMFLMHGGKLKSAQQLAAGDELQRADGGTSRVKDARAYEDEANVYHIGVAASGAEGPDGRLININGVLCGDFGLQLSYFAGHIAKAVQEPLSPDRQHDAIQ
ncbi:MAG TPA: Hint domain-containing protein [Blastocatellia bacterium]|nr:Hint domain-containing protein [Blastocatellia bacterium]